MLGCSRVSLNSKRQACVVLSTTKAEYISTRSCCAQSIWIKHHLRDFDFFFYYISLKCDNTNMMNLTQNPIMHSKTKHIKIKHHFISDHN